MSFFVSILLFADTNITNRALKNILIDHFGEEICFTYPKDRKKPQLFYSSRIQSGTVIETIRSNEPIEVCAKTLRAECETFNFGLNNSYRYANDLDLSLRHYYSSTRQLTSWETFFDTLFPNRNSSELIKRKCDIIFQIVFNIIHNGQQKTPMHTAIAQTIHDTCKSKKLIQIMNRLGLCISYDDLERIDIGIAKCTIDLAGMNRVPVSLNINPTSIVHGVTDNFDHDENTSSGIGGSHDTILMLFQNVEHGNDDIDAISEKPTDNHELLPNKRTLNGILDCQKIIKAGRFSNRGEIANDFVPSQPVDMQECIKRSHKRYNTWVASCALLFKKQQQK